MKVSGSGRLQGTGPAPGAKATPAGGFSIPGGVAGPTGVARTTGAAGVSSVDALIALQQVEGPLERKQRAVRRGGRILDVLDDMKLALLDGGAAEGAVTRLAASVREARDQTEDPGLDQLLKEIDTRAAVELAKLEMARRQAA